MTKRKFAVIVSALALIVAFEVQRVMMGNPVINEIADHGDETPIAQPKAAPKESARLPVRGQFYPLLPCKDRFSVSRPAHCRGGTLSYCSSPCARRSLFVRIARRSPVAVSRFGLGSRLSVLSWRPVLSAPPLFSPDWRGRRKRGSSATGFEDGPQLFW